MGVKPSAIHQCLLLKLTSADYMITLYVPVATMEIEKRHTQRQRDRDINE